jgi:hypothetical protein
MTTSDGTTPTAKLMTYQYLDINTGHITKDDSDELHLDATCGPVVNTLIVGEYDEGFWVSLPAEDDAWKSLVEKMDAAGYSKHIVKIFDAARKEGVFVVRFDRDGELYDQFEKFNW